MIYNDRTYKEFHHFFLELLHRFRTAIHNLWVQQQKRGRVTEKRFSTMAGHIIDAQLYGYAFLKLCRGRAFRMHVANISNMLDTGPDDQAVPR